MRAILPFLEALVKLSELENGEVSCKGSVDAVSSAGGAHEFLPVILFFKLIQYYLHFL
jgi:hypothetical protein